MPKLTQEMKDLVAAEQCFVATVNEDGSPNLGPKRSTRVMGDEHIAFAEATGMQTWANLERGSKVAIAVTNAEAMKGYRFVGTPELITSGRPYEMTQDALRKRGINAPLKALVKVTIEKIYNLGMPRPGEEIL